jgi:serine/threonine protein kinase
VIKHVFQAKPSPSRVMTLTLCFHIALISSSTSPRFDIIKKLGQGTYGKVQLGINKETGQEVAIKTIKKSKIETEADLIRIRREVQIMSSVQHPNIIHIYEGELSCCCLFLTFSFTGTVTENFFTAFFPFLAFVCYQKGKKRANSEKKTFQFSIIFHLKYLNRVKKPRWIFQGLF